MLTYLCVNSKQSLQQIVFCSAALYPHALEKKGGGFTAVLIKYLRVSADKKI
jgi:hypothetical protein